MSCITINALAAKLGAQDGTQTHIRFVRTEVLVQLSYMRKILWFVLLPAGQLDPHT